MSQGAGPTGGLQQRPTGMQGVELRHLRYLVAVADAGTFTQAAERVLVTQSTLSQQIRRLEEMVGAPLLDRRRGGVRLTDAGRVLLEESRTVLYLIEHGVRRSRQAAGVDRLRLRFALSPLLPEAFAADTAARLQSVAAAAGVDITWLEAPLDAGFSLIRRRHADAALGWVMSDPAGAVRPARRHDAGRVRARGMDPGPGRDREAGTSSAWPSWRPWTWSMARARASPVTYDAWLEALRSVRPRFEFTDPPLRHSAGAGAGVRGDRGPARPPC